MAKTVNILPIQLALGDDQVKRSEVLKRLKARMESENDLSFDFSEFDATTATAAEVVSACESYPILADKRLVLLHNMDKFKKADLDVLTVYAQNPSDTSVLGIETEKLAKNTKLYKAITALGKTAIIDCSMPKGEALVQFVVDASAKYRVPFSVQAASLLIDFIGQNTAYLENEVKKVCAMCEGRARVEVADVISLVDSTAESKAWKFLEPFSERNLGKSLEWLDTANGVSAYVLIPMCYERLRELLVARSLDVEGRGSALASTLGLDARDSWKVKNHIRYARKFTERELIHALSCLQDTEAKIKTGADPDAIFAQWVMTVLAK